MLQTFQRSELARILAPSALYSHKGVPKRLIWVGIAQALTRRQIEATEMSPVLKVIPINNLAATES